MSDIHFLFTFQKSKTVIIRNVKNRRKEMNFTTILFL